ncbi:hypothetical protein PVAND_007113 [Polypedilum vanderplanki]|uniref:PH domain-containing protein n=1 Tax=Polypedilum vanderplanki TaxID=319348 RepID=A0A9J6C588_POLVA|nr:hypothetical protein PVAND_007113 [Polypedilum vanderplanki]
MDNFTKGLLERNEMRNKALGIPSKTLGVTENEQISFGKENKAVRKSNVSSPRKSSSKAELVNVNDNKNPSKVKTVSSKKEDADVAVEINITSTQNIQVEVEVAECEFDENGKIIKKGETVNSLSNFDNTAVQLSDHSRKNLKRLGALYSETDQISSPIQRTEENFCETEPRNTARPVIKFSKLAALASDINNWDDDYSHHSTITKTQVSSPKKTFEVNKNKLTSSPAKTNASSSSDYGSEKIRNTNLSSTQKDSLKSSTASSPKKLMWDKKVIDSLEAQGFARRETSIPKLVYDYSNEKPTTSKESASPAKTVSSKSLENKSIDSSCKKEIPQIKSSVKPSSISSIKGNESKNVRFSSKFTKDNKDPAEMSLKERMAIFEKNKGQAPLPRTPFGITDANPIRSNMPELTKKFDFGFKSPGKKDVSVPPPPPSQKQHVVSNDSDKDPVIDKATVNIKSAVNKLLTARETTISEKQINDNIRRQRAEDMKCIMNRYNKQEESDVSQENDGDEVMYEEKGERKRLSSSSEKTPCEQRNVEIVQKSDDKKRSRISNPQRLYPVLSDIETTTDSEVDNYTTATVSCSEDNSYMPESSTRVASEETVLNSSDEDEENNVSIGHKILRSIRKSNDLSNHSYLESTISSADVSDAMCEMDDYLNEALENSKDYDDKGSACSDSFEYERYPKRVSFKEPEGECDIPIKSRLEISPAKTSQGSMTLVHTVSFYRRQQSASANNTPVKKIIHKTEETAHDETTQINRKAKEDAHNKIQRLLDEVMRQQTIISQTSQALNLCASTVEFSGSTEAVEGERHLLVATHRRLACLNEVQRLKVEGVEDRFGAAKEKGTLTIQEIIIPLKQTYINRLATDEINGHHLLCLVKYNEYVLATKTLPTLPGLKSVKFTDLLTFNEVYADFKITLEIYGMTAQREILPHDIKYHIQTPNKKRFKSKLQESNLVRPPITSPGGPNAVRTPALVQYGYIIFSLREIKQKSWVINETAAGVSPLNGNVYLKIDSKITVDVNHCGFLTMFDDISGFGAWHRRWCRLSGNTLYYWKYPEDEKRKEALGQLDLTSIHSERADVAPRAICARLHTILLESRRERRSDDNESLVCVPMEKHTIIRHLLAADTKEEREEWCEHLNKSLSLLKSWKH